MTIFAKPRRIFHPAHLAPSPVDEGAIPRRSWLAGLTALALPRKAEAAPPGPIPGPLDFYMSRNGLIVRWTFVPAGIATPDRLPDEPRLVFDNEEQHGHRLVAQSLGYDRLGGGSDLVEIVGEKAHREGREATPDDYFRQRARLLGAGQEGGRD